LLNEVAKIQKMKDYDKQRSSKEATFNGEYFIKMNQLYIEFYLAIESMTTQVIIFWKIFSRNVLDVQQTTSTGEDIATKVKDLHRIF
jgi:hypothetical protein